jgi:aryl-alcohol dehydrogenase-like predicted oxidoreductase
MRAPPFFDTADIYGNRGGSERFLGELLQGRRERVVLATKFGNDMGGLNGEDPGGSPGYVRRAIRASLDRLQTDHIDLYYYHRPDGVTPIGETLSAMQELVEEGLVRAIGCSNFGGAQLSEADELARASGRPGFVAVQNEYSLLERAAEKDVRPVARELGIAFIPYFPLASGLLTGKYRRGEPRPQGRASKDERSTTPRSTGSRHSTRSPASAGTRCSSWRSPRSPRSPESRR